MTDAPRLSPSQQLLRFFKFDHLPEPLKTISSRLSLTAAWVEENVPDGPEKTTGLRKLLEAKDCFVRAALPPHPAEPLIPKSPMLAEIDGEAPPAPGVYDPAQGT